MFKQFIRVVFRHEAMSGDGVCPTYMHRWTLLRLPGIRVYLHNFVGDDWSKDPHDHPKDFISIGLRGRYWETSYEMGQDGRLFEIYKGWWAPWIRHFSAKHTHRIELFPDREPCWTICIVGWRKREWGYWLNLRHWIPWNRYVPNQGGRRKAC